MSNLMTTKEKIEQDALTALKNKEERLSILRMAKSAMHNAVIEKRGKEKNPEAELAEEETLTVLRKQIKQLADALIDFEKAGRMEIVETAKKEIKVLEEYLPPGLSEEELAKIIDEVIQEIGSTVKDIGKIMGTVMKRVQGKVDGNKVRDLVGKKLS